MRVNTIAFAASLAMLTGCASRSRTLPQESLVARAYAGREPAPTLRGEAVVAFAWAQVGHRYCWGGLGPSCFDCSGLVDRAWGSIGVRIPRTTGEIAAELPEVPLSEVRMGDILWWPGHVGLYAGNGWVIDAFDSRHGVVRRAAATPYRAFRPASEWGAPPEPAYASYAQRGR
jgi:cell wall-associated NlpC family hydrolase